MKQSEFDEALKIMLNTKPINCRLKKPIIRIISRLNGLIRMYFLVKGDIPVGYEASPHKSKSKKHKGLILLNPHPIKAYPDIYNINN